MKILAKSCLIAIVAILFVGLALPMGTNGRGLTLLTVRLAAAETSDASDASGAKLIISDAWMRKPLVSGGHSAAYLTLQNTGKRDQILVKAASPVAKTVELHTHLHENGVMKMRRLKGGIAVPAGATVELRPGGLHIMLFGVNSRKIKGNRVPLTLTFSNAGPVTVMLAVKPAAGHKSKASSAQHRGSHH